ncbi:galactose-specific lectin nattectin-like [Patiria miniata]|uniref:C-type lectin n=1 Tax=Patiria miniata TaxID=46514 RepID=A0A914BI87_PATMI|nr:galactose-specific lectin nattectin-like [Patiria miniata]
MMTPMLGALILLAVAHYCVPAIAGVCPTGWERFGDSCYFAKKERMTWTNAGMFCERLGGNLAVPNSQEEQDFLWMTVEEYLGPFSSPPWDYGTFIGCDDVAMEGSWYCNSLPLQYENWAPNKPDNYHNGEHCAIIVPFEGQWDDGSCDLIRFSVCEVRLSRVAFCETSAVRSFTETQCALDGSAAEPPPVGHILSCGKACRSEPYCRSFNLMQLSAGEMYCELHGAN